MPAQKRKRETEVLKEHNKRRKLDNHGGEVQVGGHGVEDVSQDAKPSVIAGGYIEQLQNMGFLAPKVNVQLKSDGRLVYPHEAEYKKRQACELTAEQYDVLKHTGKTGASRNAAMNLLTGEKLRVDDEVSPEWQKAIDDGNVVSRLRKARTDVQPLDVGSYARNTNPLPEGCEADHIPSCKAIARANGNGSKARSTKTGKRVAKGGVTWNIGSDLHRNHSRTFGRRNTKRQSTGDSKALRKAAQLDVKAIVDNVPQDQRLRTLAAGRTVLRQNAKIGLGDRQTVPDGWTNTWARKHSEKWTGDMDNAEEAFSKLLKSSIGEESSEESHSD